MMINLNEEILRYYSLDLKMSDSDIAKVFGIDRTTVTKKRKTFAIKKEMSLGRRSELLVIDELKSMGIPVQDLNSKNKDSIYDLLVYNDLRAEVKSATYNYKNKRYSYSLGNPEKSKNKISENRILKNGRYIKIPKEYCDVFILVGYKRGESEYFIIPSDEIPVVSSLMFGEKSQYQTYLHRWDILKVLQGR